MVPRRAELLVPLILSLVLVLASAGASSAGESEVGESIVWEKSFELGLERAAIEGRLIMVDFWTTWCGWCRRLDRTTYADSTVIERCRNLVCIKVDGDKRKDIARKFRVRSYPTILFLQPDGSPIDAFRGFRPPKKFLPVLDAITDRSAEEYVLRQRLKDHPDLVDIRHDLALLLLQKGTLGESVAHFDTLSAQKKRIPEDLRHIVLLDRGRALHAAGRYKEARKQLEKVRKKLKGSERHAEALYLLAEASLASGKTKNAKKWFRKLLEVNPEGWLAEQSRSRLSDLG